MTEAAWRKRFRAAWISLPRWAREEPDRCTYVSNAGGSWQIYAWDLIADTHRRATDSPIGAYRSTLDPLGEFLYWFDDATGDETGIWKRQPFHGGGWVPASSLPAAWAQGFHVGMRSIVQGSSTAGGFTVHVVRDGAEPLEIYRHTEPASVASVSYDDTLIAISHSEHGDSWHPDVRVVTLDGDVVAEASDGPGLGLEAGAWSRVAGDQRVLLFHERDGIRRPEIWSPLTGERRALDLPFPGEIHADWYADGSALLLLHEHLGRGTLHRYTLEDGRVEDIDTPAGTVSAARARDDGDIWYSWQSSAEPRTVRTTEGVLLEPPGERAPTGISYESHHVGEVHAFIARPDGHAPHPTIVIVHGGPAAQDMDEFDPEAQAWLDHGFAVAFVNYRGSTGYGREWRDALIGDPGFPELRDIATVRAWMVDEGIADADRIVLSGASWGGYLTLLGIGTQPDLWSLAVAHVPVADYVAAFEDEMEELQAFDRTLFGGSPDEARALYEERSPITYAEAVRVPVLVLAGENDPRCPIRQIDNYVGRMRELGKDVEVYRYDAGHGSLVTEERIRQVEESIAFASRHLGTRAPI